MPSRLRGGAKREKIIEVDTDQTKHNLIAQNKTQIQSALTERLICMITVCQHSVTQVSLLMKNT